MGEELQKQLVQALKDLREGAPQAWQALCEEVVLRGIGMAVALLILQVAVAAGVWRLYRAWKGDLTTSDKYYRASISYRGGMLIAVCVIAAIASAIMTPLAVGFLGQALAPALTLLEKAR